MNKNLLDYLTWTHSRWYWVQVTAWSYLMIRQNFNNWNVEKKWFRFDKLITEFHFISDSFQYQGVDISHARSRVMQSRQNNVKLFYNKSSCAWLTNNIKRRGIHKCHDARNSGEMLLGYVAMRNVAKVCWVVSALRTTGLPRTPM